MQPNFVLLSRAIPIWYITYAFCAKANTFVIFHWQIEGVYVVRYIIRAFTLVFFFL